MNTNIYGGFQICISVPLSKSLFNSFAEVFITDNLRSEKPSENSLKFDNNTDDYYLMKTENKG